VLTKAAPAADVEAEAEEDVFFSDDEEEAAYQVRESACVPSGNSCRQSWLGEQDTLPHPFFTQ